MADAAGAVVLFPCGANEAGLAGKASGTNGDLGIVSSFLPVTAVSPWPERAQQGRGLLVISLRRHPSLVAKALRACKPYGFDAGWALIREVALIIPHQTSSRLIGELTQWLGVSRDEVTDIDLDCGNVSGASIRGRTRFGRTQKPPVARDWLLLPTVGAGMAWGAAVMRWELSNSFKSAGVA